MAVNYFEELRKKILEKEDSQTREDDLALIDALENKHPEILKNSVYAQILNNVQLMDTLITAYQKMHGSFAVYSYCGPVVQNNYEIAGQVVLSQPELITKTDLINDPNFIVLYLERVPQLRDLIRGYDVEKDDKVLAEIERIERPTVMDVAAGVTVGVTAATVATSVLGSLNVGGNYYTIEELENATMIPNLVNFTKEDFYFFNEVSEAKRDDADYLKDIVAINSHAVEYIAEHADDFGIEGLDGVKEQMEEDALTKAKTEFEEELKIVEEDLSIMPEDKEKQLKQRQLKNQIKLLENIQEGRFSPERVAKLLDTIGEGLDPETKDGLKQYLQINATVTEKKNDADYVRGYVEKNPQKIAYVSDKAETFGIDSLGEVKKVAVDHTTSEVIEQSSEELRQVKERERSKKG